MAATKTAQQWLIDSMIAELHKAGAAPPFTASSPSPGIFRLQCFGTDIEYVRTAAFGTYFAAGDYQVWSMPSPNVWECKISHLTVPGDKIWFDFKAKVTARFEVQAFIPSDAEVLKGGFNHATQTSTTPIGAASDRRLVVVEATEGHADSGRLFALTPDKATGIPIPTFQVKPTLPASGTMVGESVFVTATRQGYVWDGVGWRDITASPILTYPTDAVLQTDTTHAIGTYAVASDTGNIYVYTLDGWRRIGIVEINDYNDLLNWDAAIGTEAISRDLDVLFLRVEDSAHLESWIPISQLVRPEADITSVQNVPGLTAVASDTGKRFVNNGTRWIQDPIEHYATEAALLAATPIDGHMAWADDTQVLFTAANGTWHRLPGPQITVGDVQPTVVGTGDMWYQRTGEDRGLKIWDGTDPDPTKRVWRTADGQLHKRLEHDFASGLTIPVPAGAVEIKGTGFWYVSTDSKEAHPAFGFPTLPNNLTFEIANWRGQYFNGNASGVESAGTTWINGHNVSGKNARMGYVGGGTGWYVEGNALVTVDFTITQYDSTRIAVHWNHMFTRRNASGYPGVFEFSGIITQPISQVSQFALSVMGESFKGVTSYTII